MRLNSSILIILLFTFCSLYSQIEPTDTDGDGYRNISTLEHLRWISENDSSWSWNFELDNDIDASETRNWNVGDHDGNPETPDSAMGFKPIGGIIFDSIVVGFSGKFDGREHSIANIFINKIKYTNGGWFGFFGRIDSGLVENLQLIKVEVKSYSRTAGLCGRNSGMINNCFCSGNFNLTVEAGGLCFINSGTITNSYIEGTIYAKSFIGGICCFNYGEIIYSYSNVKLKGENVTGGFCGRNSGIIQKCFSINEILGESQSGGFCAENYSIIENCYSLGNVSAPEGMVGGFCGINMGEIINCYSTGLTVGNYFRGGFLGYNRTGGGWLHCYWDTETSGLNNSDGGVGKTTAEMKTQSTFVSWDFDNIWAIDPNLNDGYPYLQGSPIRKNTNDNLFYIYPNPANDFLYLESPRGELIRQIEIYNLPGEKVISYVTDNQPMMKLNVSVLPIGSFFIKIKTDNNIITKKIIIYR